MGADGGGPRQNDESIMRCWLTDRYRSVIQKLMDRHGLEGPADWSFLALMRSLFVTDPRERYHLQRVVRPSTSFS